MEIEENKTRLVVIRKPNNNKEEQSNNRENRLQQRAVQIIYRPLQTQKEFFLSDDMYLELNELNDAERFQIYKQLYRQLRPVTSLNHLKQLRVLQINLDQACRGIQDINILIYQLNSLQHQQYHQLAEKLQSIQEMAQKFNYSKQNRRNPEVMSRNQEIFNNYMNQELIYLLEEQDPFGFYSYQLMQCVDDINYSSVLQYGCNENFIKLLGSDIESYSTLIMRQGFFDVSNYTKRNEKTIEYLGYTKKFYENNLDFFNIMINDNLEILTLDGIQITAKIVPQIHICYGQDEEDILPGQKQILGYVYLIKYVIDRQLAEYIIKMRSDKTKKENEKIYQEPKQSFEHFSYTCSAQHFKQFNQFHSRSQLQLIGDNISNSQKSCKFRFN